MIIGNTVVDAIEIARESPVRCVEWPLADVPTDKAALFATAHRREACKTLGDLCMYYQRHR
jgi:UDP-N-acetylglucosamine 2-epimerase